MRMLLLVGALVAASPALATDKTDVVAKVTHYFVSADLVAAAKDCAPNAVVIDDFPPHVWNGVAACADWGRDATAMAKAKGIVFGALTVGKMRHVDVTGDRAYVVFSADLAMTANGKAEVSRGNTVTVALRKTKGWMITGWSWARS